MTINPTTSLAPFVQIASGNAYSTANIKAVRQQDVAVFIQFNDGSMSQNVYEDAAAAAAALAAISALLPTPAFVTLSDGTILASGNIKSLTINPFYDSLLQINFNDGTQLSYPYADRATAQAALDALYAAMATALFTGTTTVMVDAETSKTFTFTNGLLVSIT